MQKRLVLVFILGICLISLVSAESQIIIKTDGTYRVTINILKTGETYQLLDAFHQDTDKNGEAIFSFTPTTGEVNVLVRLKLYDVQFFEDEFGPFSVKDPIVIDLRTENKTEEIVNETPVNETVANNESATLEENQTQKSSITGMFIFLNNDGTLNKNLLYIGGGVILVIVIILLIWFFSRKKKLNYGDERSVPEVRVRKFSEWQEEAKRTESRDENLGAIEEAERKIREAQAEINKLKNEEKIKSMKKKIAEDEQELLKLRRGED
jgi:hypothetical protein